MVSAMITTIVWLACPDLSSASRISLRRRSAGALAGIEKVRAEVSGWASCWRSGSAGQRGSASTISLPIAMPSRTRLAARTTSSIWCLVKMR